MPFDISATLGASRPTSRIMDSRPETPTLRLQGKNVIVTGASRGFGRVVARRLAQEGAQVMMTARSLTGLQETAAQWSGPPPILFPCDALDQSAADTIVQDARRHWPKLHCLVNNAAILGPIGAFTGTEASIWEQTFTVNLFFPAKLMRLAAPWMRSSGSGSIVNLSGGGATAPRANFTAYGTTKTALVRLTETLAQEWKTEGPRVNAVAPGAMNTDMLEAVLRAGPDAASAGEYARAQQQADSGGSSPDDAARLVAFLLSDLAAGINGRLLSAVWDPWRDLPREVGRLEKSDVYTLRRIVPEDRGWRIRVQEN
jgi:NAD(P)-dependent dehydrogenase (short-subunit alcohol dehydrogenase family)